MAITNWTNITTPQQFLQIPNDNTSGWFWVTSLFLFYIVMIILFTPFNIEVAILGASFLGLVASILLVYAGLISWAWVLFFVGILIFGIIYIVWSSNRDQ